MKKKYAAALISAALMISLSACATSPQAEGEWGYPDKEGQPSLLLEENGSLSGTDGCNRLIGKWSQEDSTIEFHNIASTLIACNGVDEWLKGAVTADVSGDSLVVYDVNNSEIGTLPRVK